MCEISLGEALLCILLSIFNLKPCDYAHFFIFLKEKLSFCYTMLFRYSTDVNEWLNRERIDNSFHKTPQVNLNLDLENPIISEEEIEVFTKAPIETHLAELRKRLWICTISLISLITLAFCFAAHIFSFLLDPLLETTWSHNPAHNFVYTNLTEVFFTYMQLSTFVGFLMAFPILSYQFYSFIASGLYRLEKKAILPYLIGAPLLFAAGAAMAYCYVIPLAWRFFLSFETTNITATYGASIILTPKVSDYLNLVMDFIISFGLAFQLPLCILLLTQLKIVNVKNLVHFRKYAIVFIFIIAAILTPPDVISQIMIAIPMVLLYEISVLLCYWNDKKASKRYRSIKNR